MTTFLIILAILAGLAIVFLLTTFVCFIITFYSPKRTEKKLKHYKLPPGKAYLKYKEEIFAGVEKLNNLPYKDVEIKSFDGLVLKGKYFEHKKGAPIELMMHGYRGRSEMDLAFGVFRAFEHGRNALLVDHRAAGRSQGRIITFGAKESKDCQYWIDYIIQTFGSDSKIILTGISMGAATVMITAGKDLPKNVVGVIADCGYTSAKEIIKKVIKQMHLPVGLTYFFINLGARIFGNFKIEDASPIECLKNSKVPIVFFHGEEDCFVPCDMSIKNYEACCSKKHLCLIKNADHGLAFMVDRDEYLKVLKDFAKECGL